jgi:hypothetical protein
MVFFIAIAENTPPNFCLAKVGRGWDEAKLYCYFAHHFLLAYLAGLQQICPIHFK